MIFLRYESFGSYLRFYPGTSIIVALNIIMFIIVAINGNTNDGMHLFRYGAFFTSLYDDPYGLKEPWRYVSSIFLHANFKHLLFNLFAIVVFAPPLERLLKTAKYVPFFILTGIGGNLLAAVMAVVGDKDYHLSVGASGAIYGVYGAFAFIIIFRKAMLDEASRKTVAMILGFGIVYSVLVPQIDLWAHIGGAITGFLLFALFDRSKVRKQIESQ
ncbi:rhomboid family intramembrane serine protease [Paenibacillus sp. GSMTC-2017]|uniref:rhomboid family intramembrane serine protease n=1 Tax=Paenibacillus sp. GSMTC-2017 TaxID=2794350 RepID=UPI0018D99E02|nr:rhomboid family intramembrane serine protease [Paenibacillus sp. GSMTC-2017]MBH5318201.1 rhomboid family intramembrane serine protease [Paenibacillus sp. GSMTC-2017]